MTNVFLKRFIHFLFIVFFVFAFSCKAQKCPNFSGDNANHHVKYDKKGLVKKKGPAPQRTYSDY